MKIAASVSPALYAAAVSIMGVAFWQILPTLCVVIIELSKLFGRRGSKVVFSVEVGAIDDEFDDVFTILQ